MKTMSVSALFPAALSLLVLAGCSAEDGGKSVGKTAAPAPAAQVVGAPQDCLQINQFQNTRVRDDQTVDFIGMGKKAWRVTLPNKCPGLRAADTFSYETSLSQLCKQDIIYPLQNYGGSWQRGAGCGLAPFVPVMLEK